MEIHITAYTSQEEEHRGEAKLCEQYKENIKTKEAEVLNKREYYFPVSYTTKDTEFILKFIKLIRQISQSPLSKGSIG